MAEIKLNKPLYKESGPPDQPQERPAKAMILARIGALVLDIFALHGVTFALAKYAPAFCVSLGYAGPWVGLMIGFVYFAVCGSALTGGRTLGKFVLRLQVVDVAGAELPLGRAIFRAALLLWPLTVYLALRQYEERMDSPERIEVLILPVKQLVGLGLAAGWYLGNVLYAGMNQHGQTLYDRLSDSVEINTEAAPGTIGEFLRSVREGDDPKRLGRAMLVLVMTICAFEGLVGFLTWQGQKLLAQTAEQDKQNLVTFRRAVDLPGFGSPVFVGSEAPKPGAKGDDATTSVLFEYRHRGTIDVEALKKDTNAMTAVDRLVQWQRKQLRQALVKGELKSPPPSELVFKTAFAEFSDLFFGWDALDVLNVSRKVSFKDILAETAQTSGTLTATAVTSGTVAATSPAVVSTSVTAATTSETTPANVATTAAAQSTSDTR